LANGDGTDTVTVEEAIQPVNVAEDWEPYPDLVIYDGLVVLKDWDDNGLLKYIINYFHACLNCDKNG
jgi:hypothetical protein